MDQKFRQDSNWIVFLFHGVSTESVAGTQLIMGVSQDDFTYICFGKEVQKAGLPGAVSWSTCIWSLNIVVLWLLVFYMVAHGCRKQDSNCTILCLILGSYALPFSTHFMSESCYNHSKYQEEER